MYQIEGKLEKELLELMNLALPREVGGIIIDGRKVHCLHNWAEGNSAFEFSVSELRNAVTAFGMGRALGDEIAERVVLWHTHPGGGVGPSREDMRNKTPLKYHLVITQNDGDLVATWY